MTSFASLLSSISGQPQAPQSKPSTTAKPPGAPAGTAPALSNGARPQTNNAVAGVKRKPEDHATAPKAKVVKTEVNVPVRPPGQSSSVRPNPAAAGEYRGTARGPGTNAAPRPISKPTLKSGPSSASAVPTTSTAPAAANEAPKAKRGFASLMEKAKAAQEAAKAAGSSTIKHKPVERLSRRERARQEEAAKQQQKATGKAGKLAAMDRSRSGTPVDAKSGVKKAAEPTYKGTMKKRPVDRQEFEYKGTMRKAEPGAPKVKTAAEKAREGKYNGYVSWSDLDEAEDEEEEDYDSESDMDAGFDDMESEERMALAAAKKEDQEALEEEEQHKREKMERKRKLQALSKSAAARKKY